MSPGMALDQYKAEFKPPSLSHHHQTKYEYEKHDYLALTQAQTRFGPDKLTPVTANSFFYLAMTCYKPAGQHCIDFTDGRIPSPFNISYQRLLSVGKKDTPLSVCCCPLIRLHPNFVVSTNCLANRPT